MKKYIRIVQIVFLLQVLFVSGCGRPSNKEIEKAVLESLKQRVPVSLASYLTGGENATVEEVRVIKVGSAQGEGSYKFWPVKVYAKGTCTLLFGDRRRFEGEAEYHISKDSYGKWIAEPMEL